MIQVKEMRYLDVYVIRIRNKRTGKTGDDLNITRPRKKKTVVAFSLH
jgi:hypothetical protein